MNWSYWMMDQDRGQNRQWGPIYNKAILFQIPTLLLAFLILIVLLFFLKISLIKLYFCCAIYIMEMHLYLIRRCVLHTQQKHVCYVLCSYAQREHWNQNWILKRRKKIWTTDPFIMDSRHIMCVGKSIKMVLKRFYTFQCTNIKVILSSKLSIIAI